MQQDLSLRRLVLHTAGFLMRLSALAKLISLLSFSFLFLAEAFLAADNLSADCQPEVVVVRLTLKLVHQGFLLLLSRSYLLCKDSSWGLALARV